MTSSPRSVLLSAGCLLSILIGGCGGGSGSSGGGGGNESNPVPSISSLSPSSAPQYGDAFTLTVTGTGFISSSQIQWNGASLTTTYGNATSLTAQVPSSDLSATGSVDVKVVNPAPGGGVSSAVVFKVGNPVPVLTSISPTSAPADGASFTLTATGSNFISTSVIQWNGAALATTYVRTTQLTAQVPASDLVISGSSASANVTVLNPAPNGGTSGAKPFLIERAIGARLVKVDLQANDIAWDGTHARMYASLPSTDTHGNSVVAVDPATATVGTPVAVGSEPRPLALSSDNHVLYVGLDGTGQVKRLALPDLTLDTTLNLQLPNDPLYGQQVAFSLAVAPGTPNTFAAILGNYSFNSNTGGTVVYDNATPRSAALGDYYVEDSALEWGADGSTLYANNGTTSGNDLYVMAVNAGGLSLTADYGYLVPTQYGRIHYDPQSKYIYVDGGRVVDPATGNVIATFNTSPLAGYIAPSCALDLENGMVFFLGQTASQFNASSGVTIETFDARTYRPLATLSIPGITGHPIRLLRWGNAGLAFNMSSGTAGNYLRQPPGGPLYLLDGTFVNDTKAADFTSGTAITALPSLSSISPQSVTAGTGDTTLTVNGANFTATAVVKWNGTALDSVQTSATQLTATIPAADLSTPGAAIVSVSDPASNLSSTNSLAFAITPSSANSHLSALNLASLDLAWDAKSSRLIVPVWSADQQYPNSILSVDPTTGTITKSASVGSDPDLVRVTDDGSLAYVGFRTVNSVASLTLPDLGAGSSFGLGADPHDGPYYAYDVRPAPGAPQTTAVAFAVNGSSPPESNGMQIFDNGIARHNASSPSIGFQNIQWTTTSSNLYAVDNSVFLYSYAVDASGLTLTSRNMVLNQNSTASLNEIHFDAGTGYLYDDNGWVIDPSNGSIIGDFKASGLAIPDSALHRVFILGQLPSQSGTSNYTIQSFNQTTFTPVQSLTLNSLVGTPVAFVRWGSSGLALVTYNPNPDSTNGPAGMLYIVSDSTLVSANSVPGVTAASERVHTYPRLRSPMLSTTISDTQDGH